MLTTRRIIYAVVVNALLILSFRDVVYLFTKQPVTSSSAEKTHDHDVQNSARWADDQSTSAFVGRSSSAPQGTEDVLLADSEFFGTSDRERVVQKPKMMMDGGGGVAQPRVVTLPNSPVMSVLYCHS